jgi:hypothetical protein
MRCMEQTQSRQEDHQEMNEMNIKEFIETAREHLFGLVPAAQPALVAITAHQEH